jgi:hypothetical protein
VLKVARIVDAERVDEQLWQSLQQHLATLRREQSATLSRRGPVPPHLMWQFGYTKVDANPERIAFKPLPFWNGEAWQGSAEYPDPQLGWIMMVAIGGHTGQQFSPVLRWVASADGKLSVAGEFKHVYEQGDGVRGRIVSSRAGLSGEWRVVSGSVDTIVRSIEVQAWDTIDFVTDRLEDNSWDQFHWPVQLTLTTVDGEVMKFESATVAAGPSNTSVLSDAVLAAACLERSRLRPIGESLVEQLLESVSHGASPLIRPFLRRMHAVAVAKRDPVADADGAFANAQPRHWVAANGSDLHWHARGESRGLWLTHDDHILQLSGARSNALFFRYPLTGEFAFSCEAQQGGSNLTDGGLAYGGLQFLAHGGRQDLTVHDADTWQYEPGEAEVHPTLGRLAFLIEPDGVRLHWLTDGEREWTGLSVDNTIIEPFNRRGPKPLPLKTGDWNRVTIALAHDRVTLSLNAATIYQQPLESDIDPQFGLYHDRRASAVRVRNVVMTGDWPEALPTSLLAELTSPVDSEQPAQERIALNDLLGEQYLSTNVRAVLARAATLHEEERYRFLSEWVLPSASRLTLRVTGAFTATHPGPVSEPFSPGTGVISEHARVQVGGELVSPAYDLVDVAARLKRLDELKEKISSFQPDDDYHQRARDALLFLVEAARGDHEAAATVCERLLTVREKKVDRLHGREDSHAGGMADC